MIKIMVVDDEEDQIFTIKNIFQSYSEDYEIIGANSGKDCLDKLEKNVLPDLIILDIMMPEMSGWQVIQRLKENERFRNIPIIILSARNDETAKNAGSFYADDYIEKPFTINDIIKSINKII